MDSSSFVSTCKRKANSFPSFLADNEQVFDRFEKEVCGMQLLERNSEMRCTRNGQPYNSTESMDCRGNVFPRTEGK